MIINLSPLGKGGRVEVAHRCPPVPPFRPSCVCRLAWLFEYRMPRMRNRKGCAFMCQLSWVESSRVELSTNTHKYEYINSLSVNYVKCRGVYFHFAIKQQQQQQSEQQKLYIKGLSFHFRYTHAQIFNRLIYILLQTDIACVNAWVCVWSISYTWISDEHIIIIWNISIKY